MSKAFLILLKEPAPNQCRAPLLKLFSPIATIRRLASRSEFRTRMMRAARTLPKNGKPTAVLIGFSAWKSFMRDYLPDHNVVFFGHSPRIDPASFELIGEFPDPEVYTWSYKFPPELEDFCATHELSLTYVEDGFLRSVGLGAQRTKPVSLVFDRKAMHFDRSRPSELEDLLITVDFQEREALLETAEHLRRLIVSGGLTKYVLPNAVARVTDLGLSFGRERILVLGQVEDDLSIRYGSERFWTGNQLVLLAKEENPAAEIFYRPHPQSLTFPKPHYSNPANMISICRVLGPEYPIRDCIASADTVYTITSLAGFEAVLHGKRVVTLGRPFYSGWGFTEDRDPTHRRSRKRTPLEVLAISYGLYPKYFDVTTGSQVDARTAVQNFCKNAEIKLVY